MSELRAALGLLTVIPASSAPTPGARRWFPLVGAGVGAVLAAAWAAADRVWPPLLVAVLVVAADLTLTGMLHLDGVADAADGLLPHASRAQRLEIMADPRAGAYAVAAVTVVLFARVASLAALPPSPGLVVGLWTVSRALAAAVPAIVPYARERGLASVMHGGERRAVLIVASLATIGGAAVAGADRGFSGVSAVVLGVAAAVAVVALAVRRIGGYTGDVLGTVSVGAETAGLVVAAARW